jgi:hypothetical protein
MKYPHATMTGLLLSPSKSSGEGNRVKFVDVIPLFHLGHGLSPMLEVALLQVTKDQTTDKSRKRHIHDDHHRMRVFLPSKHPKTSF